MARLGDVFRQSVRTGPAIYNVGYGFAARTRSWKARARGYPVLYGIWLVLCARTLAKVAATHPIQVFAEVLA